MDKKIQQICSQFQIQGTYLGYETIHVGNVNQTYKVDYAQPDGAVSSYLLQNVNTYAFTDPVGLMDNISKVTGYIRSHYPDRQCLHFYQTAAKTTYVIDGSDFWRLTDFIPSITYSTVKDLRVIRSAGSMFGEFQTQLTDFDITQLHETIPNFHNTRSRYANLDDAIRQNPVGRAEAVQSEIAFLMEHRDLACSLTDLQMAGKLPLRVTHNDTKINNVLFDPVDGNAIVVIDLDTVMPGLIGHDFGDAIRFTANSAAEDCPDYTKAGVDMEIFRAFCEGFLEKTAGSMTALELDTLALSCFVMTAEVAVRFLEDYIRGDPYFKVNYPEHNLVRTRCQIALCADMLRKMDEMKKIVAECTAAIR